MNENLTINPPLCFVITAVLPYSGTGVCNVLETHAHKYDHVTRCTLGEVLYQELDADGSVVKQQRLDKGQWLWVEAGKRHRIKTLTEEWAYQCEHWDHDLVDAEVHSSELQVA
jgi:hypothetical protein